MPAVVFPEMLNATLAGPKSDPKQKKKSANPRKEDTRRFRCGAQQYGSVTLRLG